MPVDVELMMRGYRMTTAEIRYFLPDAPNLLAPEFIWQDLDLAPAFPVLMKFLRYWEGNIEGRLHSVRVASVQLIRPAEFRYAGSVLTLQ